MFVKLSSYFRWNFLNYFNFLDFCKNSLYKSILQAYKYTNTFYKLGKQICAVHTYIPDCRIIIRPLILALTLEFYVVGWSNIFCLPKNYKRLSQKSSTAFFAFWKTVFRDFLLTYLYCFYNSFATRHFVFVVIYVSAEIKLFFTAQLANRTFL